MIYQIAEIKTMQTGDINHLSTTIYFAGCNNRCPYCHNPELQCICSGEQMYLEQIVERCLDEWVCLMGGDPIDSLGQYQFERLVDKLHENNKKVCVFSHHFPYYLLNSVDHWHWHITKPLKIDPNLYNPERLSISYVSYKELNVELFNSWMWDIPLYVREANGYENMSTPHADANILRRLGFKYVYEEGEQVDVS